MPDRPVIYRDRACDPAKRPRGMNACPGPHPDRIAWKQIGHLLCTACWHAVPGETRQLLRAGVPAGAAARRWTVAKERLDAGTPLGQLRIDDVPVDDLRLPDLVPCDVREDYHPAGECPTPYTCPTEEK